MKKKIKKYFIKYLVVSNNCIMFAVVKQLNKTI